MQSQKQKFKTRERKKATKKGMKTETKWKREIKGKVQKSATKKNCNEEEHKLLRAKKSEQNEGK